MKEEKYRSLVKGVSWRVIGTLDTILISYFITHHIPAALKIGLTEVVTKIILFFLHERAYLFFLKENVKKRKFSLLKGITWRFVGTFDTILLAWWYTDNILSGIKIGSTEFLTKVVLYYFHERLWNKINFGKNVSPS